MLSRWLSLSEAFNRLISTHFDSTYFDSASLDKAKPPERSMYNKNTKKDWLTASVTAGVGAGVPAYIAVLQGQNPLIALGITGLAVVLALVIDHYW